jgi:hypothetical protein
MLDIHISNGCYCCCCCYLIILASPGFEGRGLEGAAIAEGQYPRPGDVGDIVDGIQVDRCLLLALAARQEDDAWHGSWHSAGQGHDSGPGYFLRACALWVGLQGEQEDKEELEDLNKLALH